MRYIAAALSCAALGASAQAQSLDWQNVLQRGVNEVIRSIETPRQAPAPVYTPAPAPRPAPSSSTPRSSSSSTTRPAPRPAQTGQANQASQSKQASKQTKQISKPAATREAVNARIVDNLGIPPAEFQRFFDRLKTQVAAGNRKALAKMMKYPLGVSGSKIKVFSSEDFLAHYDSIFTPSIVAAVRDQTYETLFVRDSGAAFGNGNLWVSGACVDTGCGMRIPKVVAVNPPDEEMAAAPPVAVPTGAGKDMLDGASLPEGAPGAFGPCRKLPITTAGSITVAGTLPGDNTHCYRLAGRSGQSVRIELKSVNTGFTIEDLGDNRSDLTFKTRNQPYDIMLAHTFPGPGNDHYELRVTIK